MMDYREFVEALIMEIEEETGLKVEFHGSSEKDSVYVYISEDENNVHIMRIFAEESYCEWKNRYKTIHMLVNEVKKSVENLKNMGIPNKMKRLNAYDKIKGDLFIRLINTEKNKEDLKYVLHKQIGDVALTLYMMVADKDGIITSCKMPLVYTNKWNVKEEDIFKAALKNTALLMPPRWYELEKMMENPEYEGVNIYDPDYIPQKNALGNCLSTSRKTDGAVAIFYPGVAKHICQEMETEGIYLAFTSIHEVMIHNAEAVEVEDLKLVLENTIKDATPEEDVLTNHIYHYNLYTDRIEMIV